MGVYYSTLMLTCYRSPLTAYDLAFLPSLKMSHKKKQFGLIMESRNQQIKVIQSAEWNISSLTYNFFVEAFVWDVCPSGGLPMQMATNLPFV